MTKTNYLVQILTRVHYQMEGMALTLQYITAVGKLNSVESTLPGGVYVTETSVYYCCR
jgi:hypothetical protein